MKFHYSTLLFAILVLISCEFEPSGEYFTVVKEPHHVPPIVVDLNVVTDTILIELYGTLTFEFQTADRKFHWIRFCIGNNCETYYSHTGSFAISAYYNVSFGTHDLAIEVYTGTGSGSIADALGFEGFLYSKTWTLIVLESLKDGMKILSVKPDKGSLKLTWEKYNGLDFKEYVVVKKPEGSYSETLTIIKDQNITSAYDTAYIGGRTEYRVDVNTNSRKLHGISRHYKDRLPEVYVGDVNNNLMTLVWDKSEYINNIKGYEIYIKTPDFAHELIAEITNGNDTSCVLDNLKFLYKNEFVFLPIPKKMPVYPNGLRDQMKYFGSTTAGFIGDKFEGGTITVPLGDFLYYQKSNTIYEYNYIEEEITDSIGFSSSNLLFDVSPNRKFILVVVDFKNVILYNAYSKEIKTYYLEEFSDQYERVSSPAISDNGTGIILLSDSYIYDFDYRSNILAYDFINDEKIVQSQTGLYYSSYRITSDAKFLYCNSSRQVFEIHSDTILKVPEITDEIKDSDFFDFNLNDPELFVHKSGDYLYMKRISDLSTVSECYIPCERIFNIDYNANKVLVLNDEKFLIYDLNSCKAILNYPTSTHYTYFHDVRFCYNTIYDSHLGLKLIIE